MSGSRPESVLDPVCGMTVNVASAESDGLAIERDGRTYAFCRAGCQRAFLAEPATYADRAEAAGVLPEASTRSPALVIDEGMRRWYESCSCCLSDAYPDIKAALDAERVAMSQLPVEAGICEVADAQQVPVI